MFCGRIQSPFFLLSQHFVWKKKAVRDLVTLSSMYRSFLLQYCYISLAQRLWKNMMPKIFLLGATEMNTAVVDSFCFQVHYQLDVLFARDFFFS